MAKRFGPVSKKSPAGAATDKGFQLLVKEMPLRQLRAARTFTQTQLANILRGHQSEVSKIEQRRDMFISTLASYVRAMGGALELRAVFPRGEWIRITQFEPLADSEPTADTDAR